MIKAILFDMDGVLVDARDWHYEALNRALCLFGIQIDRDAHLATFDGLPTRRKLEILSKTRGLPVKLHGLLNRLKQKATVELAYANCRPYFQHCYALARLKREGYKQAVCSNSIRQTVELMMSLAQLEEYLDFTLSNEDVTQAKPAPDIYQKAIARLGIKPHEVLIVEDNEHGREAGVRSGGHVMMVGGVEDVTYDRLRETINRLDGNDAIDQPGNRR